MDNKTQAGAAMSPAVLNRAYQLVGEYDLQVISDIAERYYEESLEVWPLEAKTDLIGRLVVCHTHACPLNLMRLLDAAPDDLRRDVAGLYEHLDAETGLLTGHWTPQCALF